MVKDSFDFSVQLGHGFVELDQQNNWRLKRAVCAEVAHLFIEAGTDFIILIPTDQAARSATFSII